MVNVFLIDDHPAIIKGVQFLFSGKEKRTRLVGSALNMSDALLGISSHIIHMILLDLYLGNESPTVNFQLLRTAYPGIPIVIFSSEISAWWKCTMFRLGANAFIDKCADKETLIKTILQVANGSILLPPEVNELVNPDSVSLKTMPITTEELEIGKEMSFGQT